MELVKNCVFSAISCSSVATGGGGGEDAPGADGEGERGWQQWGGDSAVGEVGVPSTFKNLPSHHKYKSPKQFELKGSKRA